MSASTSYRALLGIAAIVFAVALLEEQDQRLAARIGETKVTEVAVATAPLLPAPIPDRTPAAPTPPLTEEEEADAMHRNAVRGFDDSDLAPTQQFVWGLPMLTLEEAKARKKILSFSVQQTPFEGKSLTVVTDVFKVKGCPVRFGLGLGVGNLDIRREICAGACVRKQTEIKSSVSWVSGSNFNEIGRHNDYLRMALTSEGFMGAKPRALFFYVIEFFEPELIESQTGRATVYHLDQGRWGMDDEAQVEYWPLWQEEERRPLELRCDWEGLRPR